MFNLKADFRLCLRYYDHPCLAISRAISAHKYSLTLSNVIDLNPAVVGESPDGIQYVYQGQLDATTGP